MADALALTDLSRKLRSCVRTSRHGVRVATCAPVRPAPRPALRAKPAPTSPGFAGQSRAHRRSTPVHTAAAATTPATDTDVTGSTPQEVCSALARRTLAAWLQLDHAHRGSFQEEAITSSSGSLTVVATRVRVHPPGQPPQALLSVAVVAPPGSLGGDGRDVGLSVHWGCTKEEGGRWKAPPGGWATYPPHSVDAGGGAWQTLMSSTPLGDGSTAHVMGMQVALEGPLERSSSGVAFVLHSSSGQWINRGHHGANFFASLHGAPVIELPQGATAIPPPPSLNSFPAPPAGNHGGAPSSSASPAGARRHSTPAAKPEVEQFLRGFKRKDWGWGDLLPDDFIPAARIAPLAPMEPATWMVDRIKEVEGGAERSLMHRYKIADGLVAEALQCPAPGPALVAVASWLRLSAMRLLTWNRNYNIKPREIATAQTALAQRLASVADSIRAPEAREIMVMAMAAVGRGGATDVGQRVRDEILSVQSRNNCKGGMMEEWHQKLHNNTSPDDVVICEALLAYIRSNLDISQYWRVLAASNITRERLLSFDRAIRSEPSFSPGQVAGLEADLSSYLLTLKAVHSGSDLSSAAAAVLGYKETSMKGVRVEVQPVKEVASERLQLLVEATLHLQQQSSDGDLEDATMLLSVVAEARRELYLALKNSHPLVESGRLKDVMFLDLALESVGRMAVEAHLGQTRALPPSQGLGPLMAFMLPACEAAVLSSRGGVELAVCYKALHAASVSIQQGTPDGFQLALAALERLKRVIGEGASRVSSMLQPTAEALCERLGVSGPVVAGFSEEVVRCGAAAPLSQLAAILEPRLREAAGASSWQVISRGLLAATGQLLVVDNLSAVPVEGYSSPVVLLLREAIRGEEEVPEGVVGVVACEVPDVLSHAAVRARNTNTMLLGCPDAKVLEEMAALEGRVVRLEIVREDVTLSDLGSFDEAAAHLGDGGEGQAAAEGGVASAPKVAMRVPPWGGKYAVGAEEFKIGLVGNKSLHTARLYGKLARWVQQPSSVALPFGVLEAVVAHPDNRDAREQLAMLVAREQEEGGLSKVELQAARDTILTLRPPPELRDALLATASAARLPPMDSPPQWEAAWHALRSVWASIWNDRADMALRKAGLDRGGVRMAVLCQDVVPFSYSFVAHSKNPVNDNPDEIFVEVVEGLGEVLVGSYPGRGLSAVVQKGAVVASEPLLKEGDASGVDGGAVRVVGYPSKTTALFVPPSSIQRGCKSSAVIFRSDSNAEDLEGFAGAGLFDSHMTVALKAVVAGSGPSCPLASDAAFQKALLLRIAAVTVLAEQQLGGAQDVEGGVLEDGTMFIVQARPQV